MQQSSGFLSAVVQVTRPVYLLGGFVLYALGAGVARFLGQPVFWDLYWLGQVCVTMLQLSGYLLEAYFTSPPDEIARQTRRVKEDGSPAAFILRSTYLMAAASTLTAAAVATFVLNSGGRVNEMSLVFLGVLLALVIAYAVPPLELARKGFGAIIQAAFLVNVVPALAYVLQTGELHRLLGMLTFPLVALYLAMALAFSLPSYYNDLKHNRRSLMVNTGWQRGMMMHNVMVLTAYFLLSLAMALGLPWSLAWPAMLTMPVGLYQLLQMWQIGQGAKPRWRILRLTAAASLGLMAYLMTFSLWVR